MADAKITALTAVTAPDNADLLATVQDVATSPVTKKVTWTVVKAFLKTYFDSLYGAGTVTTVSVTTANGVSGSVATATSTPAITLTLGAITPSTVNGNTITTGTGVLTLGAGKTLTASNTLTLTATDGSTLAIGTGGTLGTAAYTASTAYATSTQGTTADNAVPKATYDAHSVLYATTDNTPVALTVGEQTIVGRATGGNISALAIDSDLSSVSANDDTVPSAKATKAMGDLKLPLAGGTMSGSITLGENTGIALDPAGSADGKWSGITIAGTLGATIAFGDLVYLAAADSRWELADADAATTADRMLGMCLVAGNDASATTILLQGQIRADAKFPALTIGSAVYVGETAGAIQVAIPTGADNVIRRVGYALTADEIYFNPSMDSQISVA